MKAIRLTMLMLLAASLVACAATPRSGSPEPAPADPAPVPVAAAAPVEPSADHVEEGRRKLEEGNLAAAEEALEASVRLQPEDPRAWNAWALLAYEHRDYPVCLDRLSRALELDPDYREAILNRGLTRFALRRYGGAVEDFERVLAFPSDPDLLTDYRLARQEYEKRTAAGRIDLPFPEAVRRGLLPVDREAMFARWYGRLARVLARGPGFPKEYRAESRHYVVRTDDSEGLARLTAGYLELALAEYRELFPDEGRLEETPPFAVTVFSRRQDYVRWISEILDDRVTAHISGGSYHPLFRELILTKASDLEQTLLVLYHEGFHQYMDALVGGTPTWFGEGLADYFGACRLEGSRLVPGATHPLRVDALRRALESPKPGLLRELLTASSEEFMGAGIRDFRRRTRHVGRSYALAWAFVHFLVESGDGEYLPLLMRYYDAVRNGATPEEAYVRVFRSVDQADFRERFVRYARALAASPIERR